MSIERGKYTRICVQVDLTKQLLAMFAIKGRHYNIEYECMLLLYLNSGRFGHFKEGYMELGTTMAHLLIKEMMIV